MRLLLLSVLASLVAGCGTPPAPPPAAAAVDPQRGELLYENACVACHTTQAHWRDRRLVQSWPDLLHQVARWQAIAGQRWSGAEIEDVAAYLNARFYRLPASKSAGRRRRPGTSTPRSPSR